MKIARERAFHDPASERLAWLMDRSIRIGPWSIGLDGLLGLIPGFGDLAGAVVSAFIVARAVEHGAPPRAILRMLGNIAIDALAGAVPILGDLFDFAYKANTRNMAIYRDAPGAPPAASRPRNRALILIVALILLASLALPLYGFFVIARHLNLF